MNATPINLNKARKKKAQENRKTSSDANAAKFGRTRSERQSDLLAVEKLVNKLDQHRLDKDA